MKPQTVFITRKFNLGNYQTMDIHVEASLDENENPIEALKLLEKIINDYWEGRTQNLVSTAKTPDKVLELKDRTVAVYIDKKEGQP